MTDQSNLTNQQVYQRLDELISKDRNKEIHDFFCGYDAHHLRSELLDATQTAPEAVRQMMLEMSPHLKASDLATPNQLKAEVETFVQSRLKTCVSR